MTDYVDSQTPQTARAKVADAAHDAYDNLRDVAVEAVDQTRARVRDLAAQAGDEIQHRYGDLEAWVHLKPVQALGIAAGVGVILGLLLRGGSTKTIYVREPR